MVFRLENTLLGVIGFLRKMIKMAKTQKLKISYFLNFIVEDLNHFDSNDCIWSLDQRLLSFYIKYLLIKIIYTKNITLLASP